LQIPYVHPPPLLPETIKSQRQKKNKTKTNQKKIKIIQLFTKIYSTVYNRQIKSNQIRKNQIYDQNNSSSQATSISATLPHSPSAFKTEKIIEFVVFSLHF